MDFVCAPDVTAGSQKQPLGHPPPCRPSAAVSRSLQAHGKRQNPPPPLTPEGTTEGCTSTQRDPRAPLRVLRDPAHDSSSPCHSTKEKKKLRRDPDTGPWFSDSACLLGRPPNKGPRASSSRSPCPRGLITPRVPLGASGCWVLAWLTDWSQGWQGCRTEERG